MPKKPPFSHFRKSCRSPSSGNKKEKKKLQVPSVPCKGCACLSHSWMCRVRGAGGAGGVFLVALPALHRPGMSWTCQPHKTLSWGQAPAGVTGAAACIQGDSPHIQPQLQGQQELLSPHTEEATGWAHKEHGVSFCSQHPKELRFCLLCVPCSACGQCSSSVSPEQPDFLLFWGMEKEPVCKALQEGSSQWALVLCSACRRTGPHPAKQSICFPRGLLIASLRVSQQHSVLPFPVFSFPWVGF